MKTLIKDNYSFTYCAGECGEVYGFLRNDTTNTMLSSGWWRTKDPEHAFNIALFYGKGHQGV